VKFGQGKLEDEQFAAINRPLRRHHFNALDVRLNEVVDELGDVPRQKRRRFLHTVEGVKFGFQMKQPLVTYRNAHRFTNNLRPEAMTFLKATIFHVTMLCTLISFIIPFLLG